MSQYNNNNIENDIYNLQRFIEAQKDNYDTALYEIKRGRKWSHWMWHIFPQVNGLGYSYTNNYYGIKSKEEAKAYLNNNFLRNNLIKISEELYKLDDSIYDILGYIDALKLNSCMTLFNYIDPSIEIFKKIVDKFYKGEFDKKTIEILENW